jgi:hypothetical protein
MLRRTAKPRATSLVQVAIASELGGVSEPRWMLSPGGCMGIYSGGGRAWTRSFRVSALGGHVSEIRSGSSLIWAALLTASIKRPLASFFSWCHLLKC